MNTMRAATPEHLAYYPLRYKLRGKNVVASLPGGREVLCGPVSPYQAAKSLATYWTDTGVEDVEIPCVCGARSVRVPDFSPGHSNWCLHTPQKIA